MDFGKFWGGAAAPYEIGNSLRFREGVAQNLSRSISGSPTSATAATLSFWHKRGRSSGGYNLFDVRASGTDYGFTAFIPYNPGFAWGDATFGSAENATGVTNYWTLNQYPSQPALRDFSAWYHIVVQWDSNNGTSTRRQRIWVNGVEHDFYNYYGSIGSGRSCPWTRNGYTFKWGYSNNMDGYLAEVHLIDGQVLNPTNFAEENADGVWVPKAVSGLSYGHSGYYLDFRDPASIGADRSGRGNNFTATGFELSNTSSTSYDWMADSPTNNHATINPLTDQGRLVEKNANLRVSPANIDYGSANTIGISSGKWYWEEAIDNPSTGVVVGVVNSKNRGAYINASSSYSQTTGFWGAQQGFSFRENGSSVGGTAPSGNLVMLAVDVDARKYWYGVNGTWYNSGNPATGANPTSSNLTANETWFPYNEYRSGNSDRDINHGQRPFTYTPPAGFQSLSTSELEAVDITNPSEHFQTVLYAGNGSSSRAITGVGFEPGLVWIKARNANENNNLYDSVRGATKFLMSNSTSQEQTNTATLKSFDSDGFTVGDAALVNWNGWNYAAWCWKAGGAPVTNNNGSISAQVSANPTAGFSVVTYTGGGSNGTVGHGLGNAPKCVIVKNRSSTTAYNWYVWHAGLTSASYFMNLNRSDNSETFSNDPFGGTAPTSTVFTVGGENRVSSVNYVAYCFSEVAGYSRMGNYVGNANSDGPYVYCGFKPAWVLVRARSSGSNWTIYDNKRQTGYNPTQSSLSAASTNQDGNLYNIDFLSNGFKLRTSDSQINYNGWTYIFMAFAEHSFGGGNVSPATAQ